MVAKCAGTLPSHSRQRLSLPLSLRCQDGASRLGLGPCTAKARHCGHGSGRHPLVWDLSMWRALRTGPVGEPAGSGFSSTPRTQKSRKRNRPDKAEVDATLFITADQHALLDCGFIHSESPAYAYIGSLGRLQRSTPQHCAWSTGHPEWPGSPVSGMTPDFF